MKYFILLKIHFCKKTGREKKFQFKGKFKFASWVDTVKEEAP